MKPITGYTVSELMEISRKSEGAIRSLLSRHNIKPISYEAIYPPETIEIIRGAKRGRPKIPVVIKYADALKKAMEALEIKDQKKIIEAHDLIEKSIVEFSKELEKRVGDERAEFWGEDNIALEGIFNNQKTFDSVDEVIIAIREAVEAIRNVPGKGRPAKVKPEAEKPAKKAKKAKK
jgi:hypothetical protein